MKNYDYQGESFLNRLYKDLHMSDEVMHTANSSDTKNEKVRKYLERLERVEELAKNNKYNGIKLLKEMYYKKYVIKPENVPASYFETQKKIALERGYGHLDYTDDMKDREVEVIINDQRKSLDIWLDYLMSSDAIYPEWFKYYAFQGMLKLGSYDKEKESFNKRTSTTTSIFVDLNREALALVYDNLSSVLNGQKVDDEVLQKLLENGSFSKLYAYMLKKIESSKKEIIDDNDGIWIKYNQGSEPDELVKSLEGKGTGWCTAGIETARTQLQGGDFHVYYTKDSSGEYKQPRIAIRMEGNSISEVRGISEHQNLESVMEEILDKKLEEFPDRDKYKKKVKDMETLTSIYREYKNRELTIEELRFLYEVDGKIEGFGYDKDPRVVEIIDERNFKKDLAKVFDCSEDEISSDRQDVQAGKKIICFYGNLNLKSLLTFENVNFCLPQYVTGYLDLSSLRDCVNLVLPNSIGGDLSLSHLTSAEGLKLPESINRDLYLDSLESAKGLKLPNSIGGDLTLSSLTSGEGLELPNSIGRNLFLSRLISVKDLKLPNFIGGNLNLSSLTSAEGLKLSDSIGGNLYLNSLTSAEGLILPHNVGGYLFLSDLKSAEGLELPNSIGRSLYLNSLKSTEGLKLPNSIGGDLDLSGLTSAEGLKLPNSIGGDLDLWNLTSVKNLELPNSIGGSLYLNSLREAQGVKLPVSIDYDLDLSRLTTTEGLIVPKDFSCGYLMNSYFTKNDLIAKSLENNDNKSKQRGFSKVGILIILNLIVSIGIIFLGVLFGL